MKKKLLLCFRTSSINRKNPQNNITDKICCCQLSQFFRLKKIQTQFKYIGFFYLTRRDTVFLFVYFLSINFAFMVSSTTQINVSKYYIQVPKIMKYLIGATVFIK